jgi:hypothetical protein
MEGTLTYQKVYDAVQQAAERYGVNYDHELFHGPRRLYPIVVCRSVVAQILDQIEWPLCSVAIRLNRDHSTVIYYHRTFPGKVETDPFVSSIYTTACDILGIPVTLQTCKRGPIIKIKSRKKLKEKKAEETDDYIIPVNYTKEEKRRIQQASAYLY